MSSMSHTTAVSEQRVWGGQTGAARVAARRDRLLAVAIELLGEHGAQGLTVRELCKRARLNPRYFYESFTDLDALLVAVFDQTLAEVVAATQAAIEQAPATAEDKTRAALSTAFRSLTRDPRRLQFLLADTLGNRALTQRRTEMVRLAAELMADNAAAFYGISREDELLRSSTYMLAGGLMELLIAWQSKSLPLSIDKLIEHAVLLTVGTSQAAGRLARTPGGARQRARSRAAR